LNFANTLDTIKARGIIQPAVKNQTDFAEKQIHKNSILQAGHKFRVRVRTGEKREKTLRRKSFAETLDKQLGRGKMKIPIQWTIYCESGSITTEYP
jgi:hypothetical protein